MASQFPIAIDNIKRIQDFPQFQAANVARYNELKVKPSLTTSEQNELNSLKTTLNNYLFDADTFNLMADAIEAIEGFTKDNVDVYFNNKQDEFQVILNQFSDKGLYNNSTTYQKWNTVTYNYETFISKHDSNLNNTPIGGTSDTHWSKVASRGKQGIPGIGLSFVGEYNNAITYSVNQAVRYNGAVYYCIATTVGHLPTDETYWTLFLETSGILVGNSAPIDPVINPVWIDTSI